MYSSGPEKPWLLVYNAAVSIGLPDPYYLVFAFFKTQVLYFPRVIYNILLSVAIKTSR
jgi:hypothetical protein